MNQNQDDDGIVDTHFIKKDRLHGFNAISIQTKISVEYVCLVIVMCGAGAACNSTHVVINVLVNNTELSTGKSARSCNSKWLT